jgi:hypothetical protein
MRCGCGAKHDECHADDEDDTAALRFKVVAAGIT